MLEATSSLRASPGLIEANLTPDFGLMGSRLVQMKFHGVDQMYLVSHLGQREGIDPGRAADVQNGGRGRR
jgi:hypothetical protein